MNGNSKINPNLLLLTGVIFAVVGLMIWCEWMFHDGQIFTLFVGFLNLLIGVLIGAFKSIFHITDTPVPVVPPTATDPKPPVSQ